MKKIVWLILILFAFGDMQAQWVNDPASNTFIANCENSAGEVLVTLSPDGGTFVQWTSMSSNGWSPKLQYLDAEGVPQWGENGVIITTPNLATWSPGYAIAALSDGSVVSLFRSVEAHHFAVKINADGSTPWGTDGMMLFNGEGGGRSELLAGDDGGFWALGTDMDKSYLQYVDADGTLRTMATIADLTKKCTNGKLIPADDGVFVVYAKQTIQGYSNYLKEIYVAKYNKDGELMIPATQLFGQQTVGMSYIHYAIADGNGGGYVFQWHNGIGGVYNIYVTHFNANGVPTISDLNGVTVHSADPNHYYTNADATFDPQSHDLILAYRQTDSYSQTQDMVMLNRITASGEKYWVDGMDVTETVADYSDIRVDAFEYGEGFAVIYTARNTLKAAGYDMDGNPLWNTIMSATSYEKTVSENTTGFHLGQNIITWVNNSNGGLYGQNIGWDGTMGEVTPPTPPTPPSTLVHETACEEIVTLTKIYTANGQLLRHANPEALSHGVYIIQGLTADGKLVTRKCIVK